MDLIKPYFDGYNIRLADPSQLFEDELHYRLCFVSEIPMTFSDITPETAQMYRSPEYLKYKDMLHKWMDEQFAKGLSISNRDIEDWDMEHNFFGKFKHEYCEYKSQEWVEGNTHFMFFTDNLSEQWGDDWDDAPYEYNAGWPYNDVTDLICIPVSIIYSHIYRENEENDLPGISEMFKNYNNCVLNNPSDYGYNSPFSVDMINHSAVPWLWLAKYDRNSLLEAVAINGGDTVVKVLASVDKMNELIK